MAPSEVTGDAKPRLDSEEEDFATSVIDAQVQDRVADDTSEEGEEEEEEEEEDAAIVDWREKHAAASAIWAASPEGERPSRSKNCKKRLLFNSITNWDAGCPLG